MAASSWGWVSPFDLSGMGYAWGRPFERVVSHTYPIDRISEAFRQADWLSHGGDPLRISRAAIAC